MRQPYTASGESPPPCRVNKFREYAFSAVNSGNDFRESVAFGAAGAGNNFREHGRRADGIPTGAARGTAVGRNPAHLSLQGARLLDLAGRRRRRPGIPCTTHEPAIGRSATTATGWSPRPNTRPGRSIPRWRRSTTSTPAAASARHLLTGSACPPKPPAPWTPRPRYGGCAPSRPTPPPATESWRYCPSTPGCASAKPSPSTPTTCAYRPEKATCACAARAPPSANCPSTPSDLAKTLTLLPEDR